MAEAPRITVAELNKRMEAGEDFTLINNHLIPEFKEPAAPSTWEVVKTVASPQLAWGLH